MESGTEMQVLEFTLSVLAVTGVWQPRSWKSSLTKQILYNAYTVVLSMVIFMFTLSQFMELVLKVRSADELTEVLYMVLIGIIGYLKIVTVSINHQAFAAMVDNLTLEPFKPMEKNEIIIRRRFDKMIT